MAHSSSELRDIVQVLGSHESRLDAGDRKLSEHDRAFAAVHQELTTVRNEILIMRDAVSEYCNRCVAKVDEALRRARLDKDTG